MPFECYIFQYCIPWGCVAGVMDTYSGNTSPKMGNFFRFGSHDPSQVIGGLFLLYLLFRDFFPFLSYLFNFRHIYLMLIKMTPDNLDTGVIWAQILHLKGKCIPKIFWLIHSLESILNSFCETYAESERSEEIPCFCARVLDSSEVCICRLGDPGEPFLRDKFHRLGRHRRSIHLHRLACPPAASTATNRPPAHCSGKNRVTYYVYLKN